ncbi:hypothetical protein [Streptomyces sp. S.PNR 29]|uniref:hypothetical protein n=1 Tax=Streptomyces sp. S.PNR 29 TaxID=2973805 RepID=UPI0025B20357|nr:hypothetical protein [Streptomyces sp. S.PNR 29]MDN0200079.1 hypothetical protein [Streptomyces sp. S.PNR 29]
MLSILYLARQTRISNAVAAVSANDMVLRSLREVHALMLQYPGSRGCFYDGKPLPEEADQREAIVTIAELLADVLSSGIHVHRKVPDSTSAAPWEAYCRYTLANSPVLEALVRTHPEWWFYLPPLLPAESSRGTL